MPRKVVVNKDGKPIDENDNVIEDGSVDMKGITTEEMMAVLKACPASLSPLGVANLVINVMASYDFLPQWRQVIMVTGRALEELEEQQPELFKKGGFKKHLLELNGVPERFN